MIGAAVRARGPPFNLFAAVRNQEFANFKQKTRSKKLSFYEKNNDKTLQQRVLSLCIQHVRRQNEAFMLDSGCDC